MTTLGDGPGTNHIRDLKRKGARLNAPKLTQQFVEPLFIDHSYIDRGFYLNDKPGDKPYKYIY